MRDPPVRCALTTEDRVQFILMQVKQCIYSLASTHPHNVSNLFEISQIDFPSCLRKDPWPHDTETNKIDTHTDKKVHVGVDKAEIGVEMEFVWQERWVLEDDIHATEENFTTRRVKKFSVSYMDWADRHIDLLVSFKMDRVQNREL